MSWGTQAISWAGSLVFARLLTPEDFGLITMTTVFVGLLTIISDAGIGSVVVNVPRLDRDAVAQLHSASLVTGTAATLVIVAASPVIARFLGRKELIPLLCAMSIPVLLAALRAVPNGILQKHLRFKEISAIECARALIQIGVSVVLALRGFGYWSLAIGTVIAAVAATVITNVVAKPGLQAPTRESLQPILSFSAAVLASSVAWFLYSNADFLIAGKMLGAVPLGYYSLAWNLAMAPGEKVVGVISRTVPGFLSQHERSADAIRADLCRLTKATAMAVFPIAAGLALVADHFISLCMGPRWLPALLPLRYLCVYLSFTPVFSLVSNAAVSAGVPSASMYTAVLKLVIMPPAFYVGSFAGPAGIALAWLILGLPANAPAYVVLFRRLRLTALQYLCSVKSAFLCTALMSVAVGGAKAALIPSTPHWASLFAEVALGAAVYVTAMYLLERTFLLRILQSLRTAKARG